MRGGLVVSALVVALTTGCSTQQEAYCDTVGDRQAELTEIAAGTGRDAVFDVLPIYEDLAAEAPADLDDEWSLVIDRLTSLEQAFDDAGVDPATYDPEKPPEDLARSDRAAIARAAGALAGADTQDAMGGIEQHARDVCKTELGGAPLES